MTVEQALVTFIMVLVAQVPLLVAAMINWIKSRELKQEVKEIHKTINSNLEKQMEAIRHATDVKVQAAFAEGKEAQRRGEP